MIDLIRAIMGRRHCDWCDTRAVTRPGSWFDRHFGGYVGQQPAWRHRVWHVVYWLADHPAVWKLGERWHWRFHKEN